LSIGKTTAPASGVGLDVNGSLIVSGDYKSDFNYNIKIGSDSLYSNMDGGSNVAIGNRSLYSNTIVVVEYTNTILFKRSR
jgi:hypothetical protein